MHNFKRVITAVFGVMLIFFLVSVLVIFPYMNSEYSYFQDKNLRNNLAGTIDCLVIGDSHALAGIDTATLDNYLGCNSYNLSGSMMTLENKYYMLSKELSRNPVDTVIIDIGRDTLARDESKEFAIGDEPTVARLDSFSERITYIVNNTSVNDWLNLYSREFIMGLDYFHSLLTGKSINNVDYSLKGYKPKQSCDITLSDEESEMKFNSLKYSISFLDNNIEKLNSIIDLCNSYNCRIVLVVIPESNRLIWETDGLDLFYDWLKAYADQNSCELYDVNLAKERNMVFTDSKSFSDADHLSSEGAVTTTRILSEAMLNPDTWEKTSYKSYVEMKKESQYAK